MSNQSYVLEPLLRPKVEYQSAAVAAACGILALCAPSALMLPTRLGYATGAIALGFAAVRFQQARSVGKYQYGLKHYKITHTRLHRIARSKDVLYLGEGFLWTQKHTQRKLDANRPEAEPFVNLSRKRLLLDQAVRRYERWVFSASDSRSSPSMLQKLATLTRSDVPWNPVRPLIDLGGSRVLHGVEPNEKPVILRQSARTGHVLIKGTTRVGKTRLLELLATQDIHDHYVVIIIDPKGDAELMMRVYAEASRAGRLDHLYLFHLGYPDFSARYNGIGNFARITEIATRTTNGLPSSGNSAAFKEFSWRFTNLVAQAQVALGQVPTYNGILRNITDIEPLFIAYAKLSLDRAEKAGRISGWENVVANCATEIAKKKIPVPRSLQDRQPILAATIIVARKFQQKIEDPILDGLSTAVSYEKSFFEKIIASLGPFLEKLTTGAIGKLISPDYFNMEDPRPIFDWMQVIRQGGIVYAGLDALSDPVIAGAVGNSMLADLVSIGGKIYKHGIDPDRADGKILLPHICGHFDEVEAILGDEFIPMVNRMGGAGMRVTAYTQTVSDLQAKLKDAAKAKQLLGNFNHVITLRTKDLDSAKFIADQVPKVEVATLTLVSGVTDKAAEGDGIDFISNNQDRVATKEVPLIDVADIMQLPTGQAFALLEGNRLYKLRIPLADPTDDTYIPASLRAVCEDMRSRYRTSEQWWKENDWFVDADVTLPIATPIYVPTELEAQMAPGQENPEPDAEQPALASLRDVGASDSTGLAAPCDTQSKGEGDQA
ncbi:conjugative coupling factor TraD (TOL family) [Janthinobacterium sp. 35]|uniref:type IV conjugative transfer system coupling protein TraD n=1 Tax=Janthinobacterium sp. 35 TaxID=2035210 RepID=UPI000C1765FF|nr:type IV conjugative transfer system coupling protein TraD [Janthinobacterium sp. 35]PIG25440.1 conjugative coupling factor TraD (TOL family) [Janthinobacterium sp. 35]